MVRGGRDGGDGFTGRRNSFAGLVLVPRRVQFEHFSPGRLATDNQTMPDSVRQSTPREPIAPSRPWCEGVKGTGNETGCRSSFAGLVLVLHCVQFEHFSPGRLATDNQTMPGSVRQSTPREPIAPPRPWCEGVRGDGEMHGLPRCARNDALPSPSLRGVFDAAIHPCCDFANIIKKL